MITKAPFYVSNHTLHTDLHIKLVSEIFSSIYKRFRSRIVDHLNPLISALDFESIPENSLRRPYLKWCRDLNL